VSRRRNRDLGVARGTRRPVVSALQDRLPQHPKLWVLGLDCGHTMRFVASDKPKHVACPYGCTSEIAAAFIANYIGSGLP
jgi:hypothetical protein